MTILCGMVTGRVYVNLKPENLFRLESSDG